MNSSENTDIKEELTQVIHLAFLGEIRHRRAELQDEINSLDLVEAYHVQRALEGGPIQLDKNANAVVQAPTISELGPEDVVNKSKHEAAEIALKSIGQMAPTSEIRNVLLSLDYGTDLSRKILHNSLFTAMTRKTEVFVKSSDARWSLLEWANA